MNPLKHLPLIAIPLAAILAHAETPDWPKGIDPSTLILNTDREPDLESEGFVDLFNGSDLTGWTVKGSQMQFTVEDGAIVGICDPELSPNSFLCTETQYQDFIFTTEFKWDVIGNSGIMFRADTREPDENGIERVYGYQAEMDPSARAWTGGLYGEAMDGWLYPLSRESGHAAARAAIVDPHAWNRMTIYASGNTIKTWINGVPCSYLIDDLRTSGTFGLQVHTGKQGTIRWRNIKVKEIEATPLWSDLFSSGDFTQWTHVDGSPVKPTWTIQDGTVHRGGLKPGDIVTKTSYHDFELRFDWKIAHAGNSGVKYRTQGSLGLEYQILDDANHSDGKDLDHQAAALYDLKRAAYDKPINPVGSWNNSRILVQADHITHYLNGLPVLEIEYGSEEWNTAFAASKYAEHEGFGSWTGPILLQDHADPVWYRNVQIRPLD